jgi:hypothetical protein
MTWAQERAEQAQRLRSMLSYRSDQAIARDLDIPVEQVERARRRHQPCARAKAETPSYVRSEAEEAKAEEAHRENCRLGSIRLLQALVIAYDRRASELGVSIETVVMMMNAGTIAALHGRGVRAMRNAA